MHLNKIFSFIKLLVQIAILQDRSTLPYSSWIYVHPLLAELYHHNRKELREQCPFDRIGIGCLDEEQLGVESENTSSLKTLGKAEVHTTELLYGYPSCRDVPYTIRKLGRS